jgi:hypothetical protein
LRTLEAHSQEIHFSSAVEKVIYSYSPELTGQASSAGSRQFQETGYYQTDGLTVEQMRNQTT